jgi:uncharacterized protein YjiS (DUF1127 family)
MKPHGLARPLHPWKAHPMKATRYSLHTPAAVSLWYAVKDAWCALAHEMRHRAEIWKRRREARASLAVLLSLSETNPHLLRDLGIDRGELLSMALHPDDATRARFSRHA